MKIGIVTNLYPPHSRGGAENVIVRTVEQLLAMGHDVFVITGQPKSAGKELTLGRLSLERVYRFFPKNIYFTLDDYKYPWIIRLPWHIIDAFSWSGAEAVRMVLRDEKPDVVITHNLKGIGLRIPGAIQKLGIPHIHVLHDLQLVVPSGLKMFGQEKPSLVAQLAYKVYQLLCRARMGVPDLVISPSRYLIDEYTSAGLFKKSKVLLFPNPAPKSSGHIKKERQGPLKLLFVGQLGYHKGLAFLLDAFSKIESDVRLLIAGEGPLRPLVEQKAKESNKKISYLGYTPPEELLKCMVAVDALVVPSLCYENSPTVIYEALAVGVPLLASRIGGVGELIQEGKTGYLFTPGDADDLLRVIKLMDEQKEAFAARVDEIRETVAPLAIELYAERLIQEISHVLAGRGVDGIEKKS